MKHAAARSHFSKGVDWTDCNAFHGDVISEGVGSGRTSNHTCSGRILSKGGGLSGTGSHTKASGVIGEVVEWTVLEADFVESEHLWAVWAGKDAAVRRVISVIGV